MSEVLAMAESRSEALTETKELEPALPVAHTFRKLLFHIHVIGPSECGKSTFAAALAEALNVRSCDTSEIILERYARFKAAEDQESTGADYDCWMGHLRAHKRTAAIRSMLLLFGDTLRELDPALFVREAGQRGDVICGARRTCEMAAWFNGGNARQGDIIVELVGDSNDPAYELKGYGDRGYVQKFSAAFRLDCARAAAQEMAATIIQSRRL